ncbi:MAG: hypothetical protein WCW67_04275 [Candidatus Margulisiibacteriota bacterium]|jgi:hypothetical protein
MELAIRKFLPVFPSAVRAVRRSGKPIVVFDMRFIDKSSIPDKEYSSITNAALALALAVREAGAGRVEFQRLPFIKMGEGEKKALSGRLAGEGRPLVFALSLYDDLFGETLK